MAVAGSLWTIVLPLIKLCNRYGANNTMQLITSPNKVTYRRQIARQHSWSTV